MKYTPGPWKCAIHKFGTGVHIEVAKDGLGIAIVSHDTHVPGYGSVAKDYLGNAKLIAASTDMYEAIKYAVENFNEEATVFGILKAALAKAEGTTTTQESGAQ